MRAGIQLSRSSKRAATRPKYKYFWFLYPSIESIVLAVLYRIAPIGPEIHALVKITCPCAFEPFPIHFCNESNDTTGVPSLSAI